MRRQPEVRLVPMGWSLVVHPRIGEGLPKRLGTVDRLLTCCWHYQLVERLETGKIAPDSSVEG